MIRIDRIDGETTVEMRGTNSDLAEMLRLGAESLAKSDEKTKRMVRRQLRRARRQTLPDWVRYWLDGLPFTIVGVGLLTGAIYGLSWLCHWLGVC